MGDNPRVDNLTGREPALSEDDEVFVPTGKEPELGGEAMRLPRFMAVANYLYSLFDGEGRNNNLWLRETGEVLSLIAQRGTISEEAKAVVVHNLIVQSDREGVSDSAVLSALEKIADFAPRMVIDYAKQFLALEGEGNRWVKQQALRVVGNTNSKEAVPFLCAAFLHDSEDQARLEAINALAGMDNLEGIIDQPTRQALRMVVQGDGDQSHEQRRQFYNIAHVATTILGKLGGDGVREVLEEAVKQQNAHFTPHAVEALGHLGDPRSVDLLIEVASEVGSARYNAILALGHFKDRKAVECLGKLFRPNDPWDLVVIHGGLPGRDRDGLRESAALSLGRIGSELAIDSLAVGLRHEDSRMRRMAVWALNTKDNRKNLQVKELLVGMLGDEDEGVLLEVVDAVGRSGSQEAVQPLIRLLSRNDKVAFRAIMALGKIGDRDAFAAVQAKLENLRATQVESLSTDEWSIEGEAIRMLGRLGSQAVVDELVGCLGSDRYVVQQDIDHESRIAKVWLRSSIIAALGVAGGGAARDTLIRLLRSDEQREVRSAAAEALIKMGDKSVLQYWRQALASAPYGSGLMLDIAKGIVSLDNFRGSVERLISLFGGGNSGELAAIRAGFLKVYGKE